MAVLCRALDGPTIRLSNGLSRDKSLHPCHRLAQLPITHTPGPWQWEGMKKALKLRRQQVMTILCAGSGNWVLNITIHGRSQGMTAVGFHSTLPQWHPSMCLSRGVSHALCDEGLHADAPPWKQLYLVKSLRNMLLHLLLRL